MDAFDNFGESINLICLFMRLHAQDAPLPQAVVQDRSPSGGFAPLSSTRNGRRAADNGRKSPTGVGSDSGLAQGIQRIVQVRLRGPPVAAVVDWKYASL